MTESDRAALKRLLGGDASRRATTDDLQGLLLQVVFALLMVFMIAYFIFVEMSRKERAEEILEVNRQKLVLALEKVAEDHRVKYGLNALMTQGTDGRRSFDADEHVKGGRIELARRRPRLRPDPRRHAPTTAILPRSPSRGSQPSSMRRSSRKPRLPTTKRRGSTTRSRVPSRKFASTPAAFSALLPRVCSASGSKTRPRSATSPTQAHLRTH